MPIDRLDFDTVVEADIRELVTNGVPEGLRVEYKRELYGNADAQRREALKDVSSFANAAGGHLIIGVDAVNGIPISVSGIEIEDADGAVLQLDQSIRAGVEPRIQGLRIRAVRLQDGGFVVVLRIPKSWHPPHRVIAQGSNRFWIRNSGGTHEANVDELRTLFTQGSDSLAQLARFRDQRIEQTRTNQGPRPLAGEGQLIVHVVPLAAAYGNLALDLRKVAEIAASFRPMAATGYNPRFNLDGFIIERGGAQNFGYTQVFRNGAIEAVVSRIVFADDRGTRRVPAGSIERLVREVLSGYINGLAALDVPAPLAVMFSLVSARGAIYPVRTNAWGYEDAPLDGEIIKLPDCFIEQYGTDQQYFQAVRPAFDALWNSAGHAGAESISADGNWIEPRG